jgi:hypothetical protein
MDWKDRMDLKKFSAFKYRHKSKAVVSPARWRFIKVAAVIALIMLFIFIPIALFAGVVALLAYLSAPRMLYVGPRYLICGETILYFNNVIRLELEPEDGTLKLVTANRESFLLEREAFPTNARKAGKIAANKAAKFSKASTRLIAKVMQAVPEVELVGIERTPAAG